MAGTVYDAGMRRRDRLQRSAASLFRDKQSRTRWDGAIVPHFTFRLAMCQRGTDGGDVGIYRNAALDRADFRGLQSCGSPWTCPTCAPKIAAERVKEINTALVRWRDGFNGEQGVCYFNTFTNQHDAESAGQGACDERMQAMGKALSYFKGSTFFRKWKAAHGFKGAIRGLEPTYGEQNGWHIHTHEIMFAAPGLIEFTPKGKAIRWRSPLWRLARAWCRVLIKFDLAGLKPGDTGPQKIRKLRNLLTRAFDAKPGAYAADYLAKFGREPETERGRWGLGSEVAKSHLKVARGPDNDLPRRCGHASPFELLNDYLDGDKRSGELFREFGEALHGRARLYWSPGLKDYFKIFDVADDAAAKKADHQCENFVCAITPEQWRLVLSRNQRFQLKYVAAVFGREGVEFFLQEIARAPPTHDGAYTEVGLIASQLRRSSNDLLDEFYGAVRHARAA